MERLTPLMTNLEILPTMGEEFMVDDLLPEGYFKEKSVFFSIE